MPPESPFAISFGDVAVRHGLLTREQFEQCRREQETAAEKGQLPPRFEDLVVQRGFMGDRELRAVQVAMERMRKDTQRESELKIPGYEILGRLGEGGLGVVFKAKQVSMNRLVALKVLHKQWAEDEEFRKRFLIEARVVGRLSHQNLISVYDVGKEGGRYYFSMEFVDGETVEDQIAREGALPVPGAVDIILQTTRAIQYISKMSLVHRDIKPGNIMVTKAGLAKLGDFGFVKSRPDIDKALAQEGMVLGTPDYISPEQAMGAEVDFRSDIYSLGASLYHMVAGKPPYDGSSSAVMEKHIKAQIPSPQDVKPDLSDAVVQLIERMMAKKPEDRYGDFPELFHDLELVKMGASPSTERLQVGKSTIYRALRIERDKLDQATKRRSALEVRLATLEKVVLGLSIALGVAVVAVVVMAMALAKR